MTQPKRTPDDTKLVELDDQTRALLETWGPRAANFLAAAGVAPGAGPVLAIKAALTVALLATEHGRAVVDSRTGEIYLAAPGVVTAREEPELPGERPLKPH